MVAVRACVIWRASERVWNIWTGAGRELKKYVCVGGISGATNCGCDLRNRLSVVVRCHQDATADKRPTSYGNSNSVQVFSAYTFAAQRAADWPGEQPGPQGRLSELQSVQTKAWRPDWLSFFQQSLLQKHTHRLFCLSRWRAVTLCTTSAKLQWSYTWGERWGRGGGSSPHHQPEQVGGEGGLRLKMSTSELVALAAPPLEMWLGAVRQREVLKIPACWLEWEEPAAFRAGISVTKLPLAGAEAASLQIWPIWFLKCATLRCGQSVNSIVRMVEAGPRACLCNTRFPKTN